MCVLNVCVCVHACMYPSILRLSLFDRNAAASTLTPQHTLSRQSVCQRRRGMECVYVTAMNKGEEEVVSWETWGRKKKRRRRGGREREREIWRETEGSDLREGRVRHLEKRKSHWDEEEITAAQQWFIGENSLLHLPLLPLVLQPLYLTL